jgi:hypothetical protein
VGGFVYCTCEVRAGRGWPARLTIVGCCLTGSRGSLRAVLPFGAHLIPAHRDGRARSFRASIGPELLCASLATLLAQRHGVRILFALFHIHFNSTPFCYVASRKLLTVTHTATYNGFMALALILSALILVGTSLLMLTARRGQREQNSKMQGALSRWVMAGDQCLRTEGRYGR